MSLRKLADPGRAAVTRFNQLDVTRPRQRVKIGPKHSVWAITVGSRKILLNSNDCDDWFRVGRSLPNDGFEGPEFAAYERPLMRARSRGVGWDQGIQDDGDCKAFVGACEAIYASAPGTPNEKLDRVILEAVEATGIQDFCLRAEHAERGIVHGAGAAHRAPGERVKRKRDID